VKRFLTDFPIKRKLTLVILLASAATVSAASLALFLFQVITVKNGFVRDLDALSEIIANQSTAAITYDAKKSAEEILSALKLKPNIIAAIIENEAPAGEVFARFGPAQEKRPGDLETGHRFEGDYLLYVRPIILDSKQIGKLYLRAEYRKAFDQLVQAHVGIFAAVLVGSILLTLVISSRLQRVISDPILALVGTARTVAEKQDYSARAAKVGNDELGLFTDSFNQMLAQIQTQDAALQTARDELEKQVKSLRHEITERERAERQLEIAHRELVEASRRAGMAEVATGVLHNVGNVLNSVNVSAILLRDTARKSEVTTLDQVALLLREHEKDLADFLTKDSRGRFVPQLLATLSSQLAIERTTMLGELDSLAKNIDHIKNIVAMQQNYASVAGFLERVAIAGLASDALEINAAALSRHGVEVFRRFDPAPPLLVDKHKVLQVLVNLIQNAKYALQESGRRDKQLRLTIEVHADQAVQIKVRDNGIGISPENMKRIFAHGFTTRKKGHGFGLHASALAAREMGGSLTGHSDGLGHGAVFTLELPLVIQEKSS
jgi:two-component system NtrC family sensor kinase